MPYLQVGLALGIFCTSAAFPQTSKPTPSQKESQRAKPTPSQKAKPKPSQTAKPRSSQRAKPEPSQTPKPEPSQTAKPRSSPTSKPTPSPTAEPTPSPTPMEVSSLKPEDVQDFDANPPEVQSLLRAALELTERKLGYVYGSADPAQGGMDCSGTIYFLLQAAGITDVPRTASAQYVWVRKADTFHAVVSVRADSFELDALRPGDLLFWTGTYAVNTDPPVTHSMIYLGKARSDGLPVMVGASDGRTYRGDKKFGVSVFDFALPRPNAKNPSSRFIGYAKIPR